MILDRVTLEQRAMDPATYAGVSGRGDISLDKSELIAIFIETLTYGVEALTFVATVYLLHGATRNKSLFVKFTAVILMFLTNTIHIGTNLRRTLNAFVGTQAVPVPDAVDYLSDITGFLYRFKNILIVTQTILLDVLVVYRCYMVWDKKLWIALVPAPSIVAYLAAGIAAIHAFAVYKDETIFNGTTRTWVSATLCITLFTKLLCLMIISLGILLPRPKSSFQMNYLRATRHAGLYKAALIGIECGGLAVIATLILVPVYLTGRNVQSMLWSAMSPLTGESFLLIVIASLLGFTPSTSGVTRRRKSTISNAKITIPPIPVSPVNSPGSRVSTLGSPYKITSNSPSALSDYNKSTPSLPGKEPAYPSPYFPGSYEPGISVPNTENKFLGGAQHDAFHVARNADGSVEVLQKERVAS